MEAPYHDDFKDSKYHLGTELTERISYVPRDARLFFSSLRPEEKNLFQVFRAKPYTIFIYQTKAMWNISTYTRPTLVQAYNVRS